LIWQGYAASSGHELIGHEIKVTRADLQADLAEPMKSDPWQRYCDRWYLVVPAMAICERLALPLTWGVLTPPSGRRRSMTVSVAAPRLHPDEQAPALRTLATWLHRQNHDLTGQLEYQTELATKRIAQLKNLRTDVLWNQQANSLNTQLIEDIVERLGGGYYGGHIGTWANTVDVDDVVIALKDLAAIKGRRDAALSELNRVQQKLRDIKRDIENALRAAS
jgi:hypothetical protein